MPLSPRNYAVKSFHICARSDFNSLECTSLLLLPLIGVPCCIWEVKLQATGIEWICSFYCPSTVGKTKESYLRNLDRLTQPQLRVIGARTITVVCIKKTAVVGRKNLFGQA